MRARKKLCESIYLDCSSTETSVSCEAHLPNGEEVAFVTATTDHADKTLLRVGLVRVEQTTDRRCGIGTKLYERMMEAACKRGQRLASDTHRTRASEGFWKKQIAKGRAECLAKKTRTKRGGTKLNDQLDVTDRQWRCRQYVMKDCPSKIDLSGATKRIAWRGEPVVKRKRR